VVRKITEEVVECVDENVTATQVTEEATLTIQNRWENEFIEEKESLQDFIGGLNEKVKQASIMYTGASPYGNKERMIDFIMAGEMSHSVMDEAFSHVMKS